MRIIIFTGKGGSGVSTLAAATAAHAAAASARSLAFGLAPGLAATFGAPITGEPAAVAPGLYAVEPRPGRRASEPFRDWLRELADWRGMDAALADDLAALPGFNRVSVLLELEAVTAGSDYDLITVDAPPLPHLIDLLAAVDSAARWLDRLFPVRQSTVFEPFLRALAGAPASGDDLYDHGRELLLRLSRLRELLSDPNTSSVRVVTLADPAALPDVQQGISHLGLFAYPVDAVAVNRLLPPEVTDPFFETARSRQADAVADIARSLEPLPVLSAPLQSRLPRDAAALAELARSLYGGRDPASVLHRGPVPGFAHENGRYLLSLALPFAHREELALEQTGDDLVVRLGDRRRAIPVPPQARYLNVSSSLDGHTLKVTFGSPA